MNVKKISPELKQLACGILDRWDLYDIRDCTGARSSQAVYSWTQFGNIPVSYRRDILRMARESDRELSPIERAYLNSMEKVPSYRQIALDVDGKGQANGA